MKTLEFEDFVVSFDDSEEMKNKVFEAVINWFVKYEAFCGEIIIQCDMPNMDSPNILAKLADDVIQFDVK